MDRLALVADTHAYQAGLPQLLNFFKNRGISHLACLGDCPPEPFRPWLEMDAGHRLYWVYDFQGPEMPEATGCAEALELAGRIFLAHTRAILWTHFKDQVHAYQESRTVARPPLLLCHGHTHVPSVTRYTPPFSRLLYINDALRPQEFTPRQACLTLAPDTIYLIVPGAFTMEEGRFPTFSFAVLDVPASRIAMVSLTDLDDLKSTVLFPA
ncbi:MAG: metallophosphoesterase family protein [Syntrophales bacterium]|nr:metallophosphoesterase family protein [Syntrophales bacterium]